MSSEQNKSVLRRFCEITVRPDPSPVKALLAPDFLSNCTENPEAFIQHLNYFLAAFSNTYFTVEEQVAEGDVVVTRGTWGGIHSGNFQGVPPTGKKIAVSAVLFDRLEDGKIIEHRSLFDNLGIMQQLGLVPVTWSWTMPHATTTPTQSRTMPTAFKWIPLSDPGGRRPVHGGQTSARGAFGQAAAGTRALSSMPCAPTGSGAATGSRHLRRSPSSRVPRGRGAGRSPRRRVRPPSRRPGPPPGR